MKKNIFIILLLLVFTNMLFADKTPDTTGTDAFIVGHVISEGEEIPNVIVKIKGTNVVTATNNTGHYEIVDAPTGKITLIAKSMGYKTQEITILIEKKQTIEVNFELKPDHINIEQIVVSSDKTETNRAEAPMLVNVISPKIISKTNSICGADVLNFQPGLRVENNCQNCGFTQLRMNGMEGHYTQVLINSRPVFSALNGVYGLEQIPTQMIDRIEVVRGGGSALFGGNAIAGTVNIITKEPSSDSYQINGKYSLIDQKVPDYNIGFNSSIVSDNLKTGLFIFGLKRNRQPYFANDDVFSELPLIKSNAFGFSAFHKITKQSKISLDLHNLNEFRRGGNDFDKLPHLSDISEQVKHNIVGGSLNYDYFSVNYNTKFSAFVSGQYTTRDSYYGAEQDPAAYGYTEDISFVTGAQFSHRFSEIFSPLKIVLGAENLYSSLSDQKLAYYNYQKEKQMPARQIVNQQINTPGAYFQTEWDFNFLKLLLGARYDIPDKKLNVSPVFMPRANILTKISDFSKIRISYAKGYRSPQIFDEDLHIETSAARQIVHTNSDDLTAEYSNSFSASVDFTKYFNSVQTYFLIEAFYTKLENPFSNEFVFDNETKILTMFKTNAEFGAWVKGFNLEGKFAFNKFVEVQSGFTFQHSEYEQVQPWGEDETLTSKKFIRTPDDYGYAVLNLKPLEFTDISLSGNYTGSMLVPHFAGGLDPNGNLITEDELVSTKEFFDIGVNFSQSFKISEELKIEFNVGLKNIFNSYQNDFDKGINRDAGYIYGPLLPRTLIFGLKIGNF